MDSISTSHSQENIPRGCLTFQDKIYPVYDGHNTIGRNPEAVINIKNVNISQQHAVITVMDDNIHFISDFKSSNGTTLNNKKLTPLKLYPLYNGASIKFANIFCTYKILKGNESPLNTTEASQNFSESFYAANTQNFDASIDETATEANLSKSLALHEMATQVVNIHEMATQSVNFNEDSNESIDFITMEKTSESQALKKDDNSEIQSSLESDIVPVKLNTSSKKLESDSEASTPDFGSSNQKDEEPLSQICPVKTGSKNVIDSDSDTEEYDLPSTSTKRKVKYVISDDDVTDIEDDDGKIKEDSASKSEVAQRIENPSFNDSFKLEVSGLNSDQEKAETEEKVVKVQEQVNKAITEDHLYCRPENEDNIVENPENSKKNKPTSVSSENSESENQIEEIGDNELSNISETKIKNVRNSQIGDGLNSEITEDKKTEESDQNKECDIKKRAESSDVETQKLFENQETENKEEKNDEDLFKNQESEHQENDETRNLTENPTVEKKEERNNNEEVGIFDQSTQQISCDFVNEEKKDTDDEIPVKPMEDDDIYLQPTQELSTSDDRPNNHSLVDDIYIQPTQEITKEDSKEESVFIKDHDFLPPLLPLRPSTSKSVPHQDIDDDDDDELFLPPTQALEMLHKEEELKAPSETLSEKDAESKEVEDQLEMLFASQSDHRFVATQQLVEVLEKNEDVIDDSLVEGTSFNKWMSKKSAFNSVDSIREILDESMSDDEINKRKAEEKAPEDEIKGKEDSQSSTGSGKSTTKKSKMKDEKTSTTQEEEKVEVKGNLDLQSSASSSKLSTKKSKVKEEEKSTQQEKVKGKEENSDSQNSSKSSTKKTRAKEKSTKQEEEKEEVKKGTSDSQSSTNSSKSLTKKSKVQKAEETKENDVKEGNEAVKVTEKEGIKGRGRIKGKNANLSDSLELKSTESQNSVSDDSTLSSKKKGKSTKSDDSQSSNVQSVESQSSIDDASTKKNKVQTKSEESEVNLETSKENRMYTRKSKRNAQQNSEEIEETNISQPSTSKPEEEMKKVQNTRSTRSTKAQPEPEIERQMKRKAEVKASESEDDGKRRKQEEPTKSKNPRKRASSSEDEFVPKTPRKTLAKSVRNKKDEEEEKKVVETPTTRRSTRYNKKVDLDQEIVSVPSTSTIDEDFAVPSTSSASMRVAPTKRGRKLSANSRAMKNEEEKHKTRGKNTPKLSSLVGTPERNKRQLKPKVVFTMMDNPELESLIRQLGGSVVDTVDACTVLVTESVKRSQKLLRAVAQGKPICSPQWLHDCRKSFKFLDPWDYILEDEEAEKKWDFSLRESVERGSRAKLLDNYTFQVMATTAADVLKGAIEACGGRCVGRNLAKAGTDNLVIVATPEQKTKFAKIVKENPKIKVVEPEAIFDGTLRQEFRFDRHLLT